MNTTKLGRFGGLLNLTWWMTPTYRLVRNMPRRDSYRVLTEQCSTIWDRFSRQTLDPKSLPKTCNVRYIFWQMRINAKIHGNLLAPLRSRYYQGLNPVPHPGCRWPLQSFTLSLHLQLWNTRWNPRNSPFVCWLGTRQYDLGCLGGAALWCDHPQARRILF